MQRRQQRHAADEVRETSVSCVGCATIAILTLVVAGGVAVQHYRFDGVQQLNQQPQVVHEFLPRGVSEGAPKVDSFSTGDQPTIVRQGAVAGIDSTHRFGGQQSDTADTGESGNGSTLLPVTTNGVLAIEGSKLVAAGRSSSPTKCRPGTAFFIDDGCALGHTVKDAGIVFSYLQRHLGASIQQEGTRDGNKSITLVFGNKCSTRRASPSADSGPTRLFHNALVYWFAAAVSQRDRYNDINPADRPSFMFYTDVAASQDRSVCFNKLLRRPGWRWFRRAADATDYRSRLLRYFRLSECPSGSVCNVRRDASTPLAISTSHHEVSERNILPVQVIVVRRRKNRHFGEDSVAAYLAEHIGLAANVTCVVLEQMSSYREQIALLHAADIVVAAHGAALSSVVAMRRGSVLIELFPHNFRYLMYEELARLMGLYYYGFEARRVANKCCAGRGRVGDSLGPVARSAVLTEQDRKAGHHAAYGILRRLNGIGKCKNCDIAVEPDEVLYLVKDAMSSIVLMRSRLGTAGVRLADRRA